MLNGNFFLNISNKNLPIKRNGKKRKNKKVRRVALNNKKVKSIEERQEIVESREELGHWEIDLVIGKKGTKPVVLTLVERKSCKSIYALVKIKLRRRLSRRLKGRQIASAATSPTFLNR